MTESAAGMVSTPIPVAPQAMEHQQQQQQQQWGMTPQQASKGWNQQPPAQYPSAQPTSTDEIRTLWIGDLQYWMEESYLHGCFAHTGEVISVKVIRNKQTGQSEGYGFIEFVNYTAAERVLQMYNGKLMPKAEQTFRLNWATLSAGKRCPDDSADFTIFVGDLASDVTDYKLQETFRVQYPSVKGPKVVTDRVTGRSKGCGFVRFGDESEQLRAMSEMNGPKHIGPTTTKKSVGDPKDSKTLDLVVNVEKRLTQLQAEFKILDRLIYKGKNQHRRCIYYQYLLKVRRDLRVLQSMRLEEILKFVYQLIDCTKPKETMRLLESMKRKDNLGRPNFQQRFLGVARLLSQMVEPMVKAAMEISCLLAQSFFMAFSVTILALLARLRVLVQQILLDVVSIFNTLSSLSQKLHTIKFIQEGIEVLRDYYPANEVLILECVWKTDKFVLIEKNNKIKEQRDPEVGKETSTGTYNIQYQTIDAFLGEDNPGDKTDNFEEDLLEASNLKRHKADTLNDQPIKLNDMKQSEESLNNHVILKDGRVSHPSHENSKMQHEPVGNLKPLQMNEAEPVKKESSKKSFSNFSDDNEDRFFNLLTGGNMRR